MLRMPAREQKLARPKHEATIDLKVLKVLSPARMEILKKAFCAIREACVLKMLFWKEPA